VERAKKQLKHFSNRGCERGPYAGTVKTLRAHDRPTKTPRGSPADEDGWPDVAWLWPELAVRSEAHPSEIGVPWSVAHVTLEANRLASRATSIRVPRPGERRRNAAILPETSAIQPEADLHNLQNPPPPFAERVRNPAILPETAALHPETALHNWKPASAVPRRRRNATDFPGSPLTTQLVLREAVVRFRLRAMEVRTPPASRRSFTLQVPSGLLCCFATRLPLCKFHQPSPEKPCKSVT
jgi:hypothetical protein